MRLAILAFEHCLSMEVCTISDLLLMANRVAQHNTSNSEAPFQVEVVSVRGRRVKAAGSVDLTAAPATSKTDLLVVPGVDFARLEVKRDDLVAFGQEVRFIQNCFSSGVPVASICAGAFLLGEAGLLDNRRATTAWLFAPQLAALYPAAEVEADALLVEDRGVTTAGAFSAAADLALHLIHTHASPSLARQVGGLALIPPSRHSQAPYIEPQMLQRNAERFSTQVERWLFQRYTEPYDLKRLADAFHVSTRTLLRRFRHESGTTPLHSLQRHRVQMAKHLLRTTSLTVAQITERVGYQDVATFCGLFSRLVQLSPTEYRRQFAESATSFSQQGDV